MIHQYHRSYVWKEIPMIDFVLGMLDYKISIVDYGNIETGFLKKWNSSTNELLGDGDMKNSVYRYLESLKRDEYIPQKLVDKVVDEMLRYMELCGEWKSDFSLN